MALNVLKKNFWCRVLNAAVLLTNFGRKRWSIQFVIPFSNRKLNIDVLQSFSTFAQSLSMRPKNGQYICFLLAQMTCGFFLTSILVRASFEQCNFNAQISENWRVLDKNWEFVIKSESFWFESRIQDERVSVKNHDFMTKT